MPNLVGTGLNQVPTNGMLGGLAYQSPDHASIKDLDLKYLSQINASTADTAVDVFVYDTSRDSDGGAWRKRTQHTSWYNETLNTATRGSRREFPAVAVIVAETTKVTIYDGDDPDLPMWMVFPTTGYISWASGTGPTISSVSMLNAILVVGTSDSKGNTISDFIKDDTRYYYDSAYYNPTDRTIKGRNVVVDDGTAYVAGGDGYVIVNFHVNDVAMTVLPTAPIDSDTGLQVPTIAVATNGGISVIKDDGTVINGGDTGAISKIHITEKNRLYYTFTSFNQTREVSDESYWTKSGFYGTHQLLINSSPPLPTNSGNAIKVSTESYGTADGLVLHSPDPVTAPNVSNNNGMVAYATTSYNTGWMHGDIKGAFLSDTDATNSTDTELVSNGTFDSNTDGWSTNPNGTLVSSGGRGVLTNTQSGDRVRSDISFTTVIGKRYRLSFNTNDNGADGGFLHLGTVAGGVQYQANIGAGGNGDYTKEFTATTTTGWIQIGLLSTANGATASYDDISVKLIEDDRSVNNNGLQVFGTITKSAVAGSGDTAAELVAYSGWSNSNYLLQPYNSDLDFSGSFYIMCWVKTSDFSTNNQYIIWKSTHFSNTTPKFEIFITSGYYGIYIHDGSSGGSVTTSGLSSPTWGSGVWSQLVFVRSGSTGYIYENGVLKNSGALPPGTISTGDLHIGRRSSDADYYYRGSISLVRTGVSVPSAEQIKKIYEDEKVLFQENANATLYGSSDAVTALAYDEKTNLLHVGTSSGRSDFNGLRRINNTTEAVTTAISAYDGSIAQQ